MVRPADRSASPAALEHEVLRELEAAGVYNSERLRLTTIGRSLFLDGFVESVEQKLSVEKACKKLVPGSTVVNRLRVAAIERDSVLAS